MQSAKEHNDRKLMKIRKDKWKYFFTFSLL